MTLPSGLSASRPTAPAVARAAAASALVLTVALLLADLRDGSVAYSSAGLLTLICGSCLVGWRRLELARGWARPQARQAEIFGLAMMIRGVGWLALALEASDGTLGALAVGDLAMIASSLLAAVGLATATVRRNPRFAQRLFVDAVICGTALLMLVWSAQLGARLGFDIRAPRAPGLVALAVICLIVITMAGIRLVSEPFQHTWATLLAACLISIAELDALGSRADGMSELGWLAVACWFAGWPLLTWRIVSRDVEPAAAPDLEAAERRELVLAELAPAMALGTMLAAVLVRRDDLGGFATDPVIQVSLGVVAVTFAVREVLLSRTRARLTAALRLQAELDPLTELANRRGLAARVERLDPQTEWTLLAVDLDGFKTVNDVLGHGVGDRVLAAVGRALISVCPPEGLAARTGGDEFALLCAGGVDRGLGLGLEVVREVEAAVLPMHLGIPVTASVGVGRLVPVTEQVAGATPPEDRLTPLVEAGAALRAAKQNGGNQVRVYPGLVAQEHLRRLLVEVGLRSAVETGAITSAAQPLVDLTTGRVVGVEALARWRDPVLGDVPPAEFVAVGEQAGLVGDIGRAVLASALEAFERYALVERGLMLSLNVSPLELRLPGFAQCLTETVGARGMPLSRLTVEVTEAVLIEQDDPAVRTLADLASRGVRVAIDDFGAGYSALGYLRRLPVTTLKLDRSLVTESLGSPRTREIVAGVVDLARRLHLTVVFEGIEDERTAALGVQLGAMLGQGFWCGPPLAWADLAARVAAQEAAAAVPSLDQVPDRTPDEGPGRPSVLLPDVRLDLLPDVPIELLPELLADEAPERLPGRPDLRLAPAPTARIARRRRAT